MAPTNLEIKTTRKEVDDEPKVRIRLRTHPRDDFVQDAARGVLSEEAPKPQGRHIAQGLDLVRVELWIGVQPLDLGLPGSEASFPTLACRGWDRVSFDDTHLRRGDLAGVLQEVLRNLGDAGAMGVDDLGMVGVQLHLLAQNQLCQDSLLEGRANRRAALASCRASITG